MAEPSASVILTLSQLREKVVKEREQIFLISPGYGFTTCEGDRRRVDFHIQWMEGNIFFVPSSDVVGDSVPGACLQGVADIQGEYDAAARHIETWHIGNQAFSSMREALESVLEPVILSGFGFCHVWGTNFLVHDVELKKALKPKYSLETGIWAQRDLLNSLLKIAELEARREWIEFIGNLLLVEILL